MKEQNSENSSLSKQEGGSHYKGYAIQPVQYAHANHLDFFQGSVVKYVTRFRDKNGKEDLLKARHFIDMLIELEYGVEDKSEIKPVDATLERKWISYPPKG